MKDKCDTKLQNAVLFSNSLSTHIGYELTDTELKRMQLSWHYPNSPKNRKTALIPRHDWLQRGSTLKKDPLRIWFYPQ